MTTKHYFFSSAFKIFYLDVSKIFYNRVNLFNSVSNYKACLMLSFASNKQLTKSFLFTAGFFHFNKKFYFILLFFMLIF